ncbi:extracellular solute-binding protein [Paenibacillus thermoaerophilus]
MEEILKQFTAKYNIPVKFEEVTHTDQATKLTTDGPAKIAADVVTLPHNDVGRVVQAGLVLPNDFFEEETKKENQPSAIQGTSYDGTLYGYPRSMETYALFYNKKLVQTPPKTYDEIIAFAKTFNDKAQNKYAFMWEIDNFYYVYSFLTAHGGYVFGKNGTDKNDIGLNNEGAVKGLQAFAKLREALPVKAADVTYDIKKGLFTGGTLALDINGPWTVGEYKKAGLDFGVAPLPLIDGKPPVSFAGIRASYVNAHSKYPNAARLLARFITTKEAQLLEYKLTGTIPANIEAGKDPALAGDATISGFAEQLKNSQPMPSIPEMNSVWEPMKAAAASVWNDGVDPKQALDNAVKQIKDLAKLK